MIPQFELFGIAVPTYLLTLSLVYCIGLFYFFKRLQRFSLNPVLATDLALGVMLAGFVGARLFYVFYQEPRFYFENPLQVFKFWHGGFVFYGGLLASFLFGFLYLKYQKQNLVLWLNVLAPVLALGYGLGRWACFFDGCCYGGVCHLPWAASFPHLAEPRHPTQLYAVLYELLLWVLLIVLEKKHSFKYKDFSLLFVFWLVGHGVGRLIMESFRDDNRGALIFGLSVSTWISLGLIFFSLAFVFRNRNFLKP